jgi:hypothetical protein
MGASVNAYWPGISEDDYGDMPGFYNDCKAWGDWMAERERHPKALRAMKLLGVSELLTCMTEGVGENDVQWVTPDAMGFAALRLRAIIQDGGPGTDSIIESYAVNANNVDPVEDEFARDLWDVAELARSCKSHGVERMTLEVLW